MAWESSKAQTKRPRGSHFPLGSEVPNLCFKLYPTLMGFWHIEQQEQPLEQSVKASFLEEPAHLP